MELKVIIRQSICFMSRTIRRDAAKLYMFRQLFYLLRRYVYGVPED